MGKTLFYAFVVTNIWVIADAFKTLVHIGRFKGVKKYFCMFAFL